MQFLFRDLINKLIAQGTFNEARFYIAEMIIKSIVIIYRRKHLCIEVEIDKKYFLFLYEIKTRFLGKINALFKYIKIVFQQMLHIDEIQGITLNAINSDKFLVVLIGGQNVYIIKRINEFEDLSDED